MVKNSIFEICNEFCKTISPSGYEDMMAQSIIQYIKDNEYDIYFDKCNNLICKKTSKNSCKRIAFIAHMDSAPIIINGIDSSQNIYWGSLSKWKYNKINNQSVTFVSGATAIAHMSEDANECNLLSDICGQIELGDVGALTPFFQISGDYITATFLDDRIGCAILVDVARRILEANIEISFIFTAQEEIGNKGARKIAQYYQYDEVYSIDTTRAISPEYNMPIYASLGKGACMKICDGSGMCSRQLNEKIKKIAETHNIPLQKEILFRGGSDISAFARHGYNTLFTGISVPCINMHSREEKVSLVDVNAVENLILSLLKVERCKVLEK